MGKKRRKKKKKKGMNSGEGGMEMNSEKERDKEREKEIKKEAKRMTVEMIGKKRVSIAVFAAVIIVVAAGSFLLGRYIFPTAPVKKDVRVEDSPITPPKFNDENNLIRGAESGYAVTVREYTNFFCGYCRKVQEPMNRLIEKYPKKLRHILKSFPNMRQKLSPVACKAVFAALKQNKGEQIKSLIFSRPPRNEDDIIKLAGELGMDIAKFRKDMNSDEAEKKVQSDLAEARALRFRGTPSFWVDGMVVRGFRPFDYWDDLIRQKIK